MAALSDREIKKALADLARLITVAGILKVTNIEPSSSGGETDGDIVYNAATHNLWIFNQGSYVVANPKVFLVRYEITRTSPGASTLSSTQWQTDVLAAASANEGITYSNLGNIAYGSVFTIVYNIDGVITKVSGKLTDVDGVDTWVDPGEIIDGDLTVTGTLAAQKLILDGTIFEPEVATDALTIKTDGIEADLVAFKADTFEEFTNVGTGLTELAVKTDGIQADQVAFKDTVFESQRNVADTLDLLSVKDQGIDAELLKLSTDIFEGQNADADGRTDLAIKSDGIQADLIAFKDTVFESQRNVADTLDLLSIKDAGIEADLIAFKDDTFTEFTNVGTGLNELAVKTDGIQADQVAFKDTVFESQRNVADTLDVLAIKDNGIQADQIAFKADVFDTFDNVGDDLQELTIKQQAITAQLLASNAVDVAKVTYGATGNTFEQNSDFTYTTTTRTATATLQIGGILHTEVIDATLGTDGNITISTTTDSANIAQTVLRDDTQNPIIEFSAGNVSTTAYFLVNTVAGSGEAGTTTLIRYAKYLPGQVPTAPSQEDGKQYPWYTSPDLVAGSYTHSTVRQGRLTSTPKQTVTDFDFSGSGGGSYQSSREEIASLTVSSGANSATTTSETIGVITTSVSGDTGSAVETFDYRNKIKYRGGYVYFTDENNNLKRTNDSFSTISSYNDSDYLIERFDEDDSGNIVAVTVDGTVLSATSAPFTNSNVSVIEGFDFAGVGDILWDSTEGLFILSGNVNEHFDETYIRKIYTSPDASTWTERFTVTLDGYTNSDRYENIENVNGRFYATNNIDALLITSDNALDWEMVDIGDAQQAATVVYNGANYYTSLSVSYSPTVGSIGISTDGITFTELEGEIGLSSDARGELLYSSSLNLFALQSGTGIYTSPDALNWTLRETLTASVSTNNKDIIFDGTNYLVKDGSLIILKSTDLINWSNAITFGSLGRVSLTLPLPNDETQAISLYLDSGLSTAAEVAGAIVEEFNNVVLSLYTVDDYWTAANSAGTITFTQKEVFEYTTSLFFSVNNSASSNIVAGSITTTTTPSLVANTPSSIEFTQDGVTITTVTFDSAIIGSALGDQIQTELNADSNFPYTVSGTGLTRVFTSKSNENLSDLILVLSDGHSSGNIEGNITVSVTQQGRGTTVPTAGTTASVITITKTGGERNGTATTALGSGETIVSQLSKITQLAETLHTTVIPSGSNTLRLIAIEQAAVVYTVNITDGAVPTGDPSVTESIGVVGEDEEVTFLQAIWSNPANTGVNVI